MSSTYGTPAEEAQQVTTEGQQMFQRTMSAPFQQFTSFQRDMARLLLENLEFQAAVQRQTLDLARSAVRSYVDAIDATAGPGSQPGGRQQYQRAPSQVQQPPPQQQPPQPFQQPPPQQQPPQQQQYQPPQQPGQQQPAWQQTQAPPQQTQQPGWQQTPMPQR